LPSVGDLARAHRGYPRHALAGKRFVDLHGTSGQGIHLNLRSKGVTPIAILSTEDFDATRVQVGSVRVGPAAATVDKASVQDVNGDGRADQLLHVSTPALGLRSGDTALSLSGTLRDGVPFVGTDQVRVMQ
jgi:hypothetical protein